MNRQQYLNASQARRSRLTRRTAKLSDLFLVLKEIILDWMGTFWFPMALLAAAVWAVIWFLVKTVTQLPLS